MDNIYLAPKSTLSNSIAAKKGRALAILGSILQIPIYLGFIAFVLGVILTFYAMYLYESNNVAAIAAGLSSAIKFTLLGGVLSLPGLIVTLYVLLKTEYRARWFSRFNLISVIFWLLSFPFCTVLGLLYALVFFKKGRLLGEECNK